MPTARLPASPRVCSPAAGSCTVELTADVLAIVRADARARGETVAATVHRWIRDRAEELAAERGQARALQANQGQSAIAAEDLCRECGLLDSTIRRSVG